MTTAFFLHVGWVREEEAAGAGAGQAGGQDSWTGAAGAHQASGGRTGAAGQEQTASHQRHLPRASGTTAAILLFPELFQSLLFMRENFFDFLYTWTSDEFRGDQLHNDPRA
jgi:hypothetical protein